MGVEGLAGENPYETPEESILRGTKQQIRLGREVGGGRFFGRPIERLLISESADHGHHRVRCPRDDKQATDRDGGFRDSHFGRLSVHVLITS